MKCAIRPSLLYCICGLVEMYSLCLSTKIYFSVTLWLSPKITEKYVTLPLTEILTWPHDFILVGQSWACNEIWNNTQACSCFQQLLFKNTLMQELKTLIMTLIGSFIPHYHGRNIWDKNSWSLSSFNSEARQVCN